ncbi:acetyl-CoA acetyltransferase [Aestuariicella hydrocarbonica]|uniref:Acetyl-CoA acetyltransferase n=1 Tax=Pseudomaricurvus hydrocarbonicus TaxID=1470433 RepID=A0A9E5T4X2_9GAMM|nr:acetyl-CoA acetyltransferase [Aestuariicella hydrocarbonica]NHO68508.1 acetyl-CoA acetyltransferase [Aestuariicella hydrocarbonica]
MTQPSENTPILVGAGQVTEPVPEHLEQASSHADLAGQAARAALSDARDAQLAAHIDTIVGVRTFADSTPLWACPFGGSNNFPRSVGRRIGAQPRHAVYEILGGQSPQKLVGEFAERLHRGDCEMVLLAGGEAMATIKVASKQPVNLDWSETVEGQLEDRGMSDDTPLISNEELQHQLFQPVQYYGLMEHARRADLGQSLPQYSRAMGDCFAALSQVAANNPYSMYPKAYDAETLITASDDNPMVASPYPKHLVAKDGVNQAAALLLTTVGKAKELGIDPQQWVFLHGYADTCERTLLERPRLGHSKAMEQALLGALAAANKASDDLQHLDIYSCFPIVVTEARAILGIAADDPRPLTQTGGLAFFGGPGNNYTMHGIASLMQALRKDPGSFGLAYGNGGWMSKHSAGVYSTAAPTAPWQACDSKALQARVDHEPRPEIESAPAGEASLETYTINYRRGEPTQAVIVGRLTCNGKRFYALTALNDTATLQRMLDSEVLGASIRVQPHNEGNRFTFV